jgi:hypothetical protein
MTNCLFGWENRILSASALTASSEATGMTAGNLQSQQGTATDAWQTAAGVTDASLVIDMGADVLWRAFGLFRTNLTPAATVRWRVGADAAFATSTYDSGALTGIVTGFGQHVHVMPADVSARYARADISDATNTDTFLNIPLAFAGPVWIPQRNLGFSSAVGREHDAAVVRTRSGGEYVTLRSSRRRWAVSLPALTGSEVWPQVFELDSAAADGRNILFVPFPEGDDVQREAVFGRLASGGDVTWPAQSPARRAWSAIISERL